MSEIMAKNSTRDGVTYLTVHSVGSPVGHKDRDRCGIYPDYLKGSICYRICGEIPRGRKPNRVEFFSRISHQGDDTLWVECPGDGCEGSDPEFHKEGSKICGLFKLWKGDGSHHDLMMKVYLE
jgi:hypothetical protein